MACRCSPEAFRIMLWMCWVTNMLITTIYYLLSFTTFYKLLQASGDLAISKENLWLNTIWRAPLAATLLGGLLVLGFNLFSCIILIKKSINRSGPGFGYGFLVAFCFTLAFFLLLVGLIMDGFRNTVHTTLTGVTSWTKYSTELYIGAEVFAFITVAMLMVFFLALVIFQGAVSDQLGISRDMNNPYAPMEAPGIALGSTAVMGSAAAGAAMGSAPLGMAPTAGLLDSGKVTTPQYGTYTAPELPADTNNFNYYNSAQGYQQPSDYQNTNDYQTTDYQYETEQGYQGQYQSDSYQPTNFGNEPSSDRQPLAPGGGGYSQAPSDFNAAAAYHGQQGAFATPGVGQQL